MTDAASLYPRLLEPVLLGPPRIRSRIAVTAHTEGPGRDTALSERAWRRHPRSALPVLAINTATLWHVLRSNGFPDTLDGPGRSCGSSDGPRARTRRADRVW